MTGTQKVIKYIAMGFGFFLALNIICFIAFGVLTLSGVYVGYNFFMDGKTEVIADETIYITEQVSKMDIDIGAAKLLIKQDNNFRVELKNVDESTKIDVNNGNLNIIDNKKGSNILRQNSTIIVYIPENIQFNNFNMKLGLGSSEVEKIEANNVNIEIGAGSLVIDNLNTKQDVKIEGGAGRIEIKSGELNNLRLNSGVGETVVTSKIIGNSKIESGIGSTKLNLYNNISSYSITTNIGIGSVKIDEEKCEDGKTYGTGESKIEIDGGIGSVQVNWWID